MTDEYKFDRFVRGEYHTDIRLRAAKQKLGIICLKTELVNNVKIISKDISNNEFTCKIFGTKKNVEVAKKFLDQLFNERLEHFKCQLLPYNLYEFAQKQGYFESSCKKWNEFEVELKYGYNDYRGTHENFVNIIGSSKSVHNFYKDILTNKCNFSEAQNDDGNCFKDTIEWPPHYLKCLQILGFDIENCKEVKSIHEFLSQCNNVEAQIKDIEMINYPPEWIEFNAHKTTIQKLKNSSKEYKQIKDIFRMGNCKSYQIQKIERIINPFLYNLYECKKREMMYKHFKNPDYEFPDIEKSLWHGTSKTSPLLATCQSDEGIDKRFMKTTGDDNKGAVKYYGIGCYFSTTAGYSDNQYSYPLREMKEAREVLVGSSNYGNIALEQDQMRTLSQRNLNARIENRIKDQLHPEGTELLNRYNFIKNNKADEVEANQIKDNLDTKKAKLKSNYITKSEENSNIEFLFYPEREDKISSLNSKFKSAIHQKSSDLRYDSIMDDRFMLTPLNNENLPPEPRMYVTFDNAQSYPAYIITYGKYVE